MKIVLTGMYAHQLDGVARELRAEFPEHRFDVVDGRVTPGRMASASEGADVVVLGRFTTHTHDYALSARHMRVLRVMTGSAGRIKQAAVDFLRRGS